MSVLGEKKTVKLGVEGMHCAGCVGRVEGALRGVPGVKRVAVSLDAETAEVTFDPAKTTPGALADAVAKTGYRARET